MMRTTISALLSPPSSSISFPSPKLASLSTPGPARARASPRKLNSLSYKVRRCSASSSPPPPAPTPSPPPPPEFDSDEASSSVDYSVGSVPSAYNWLAGLGALGFVETCYLTVLKVTETEVVCPVGGGSCGDVLNSDYAEVFGIPLPLYGAIAYGFVAFLGFQLSKKRSVPGFKETEARLTLLLSTTAMATASSYFLYILTSEFAGVSCPYCLFSAALSFTLFFVTVQELGFQEIKKVGGVQLVTAALVFAALSNSYSTAEPPTSNELQLEPFETAITTESTPFAISLAEHLRAVGAKMYGAFWCSHCQEQKQMFGREAMKIVDYVECFPDGAGKGKTILKACSDAGIEGFPTWIINGQVISGEQELSDLAEASGFTP